MSYQAGSGLDIIITHLEMESVFNKTDWFPNLNPINYVVE
jgi:hypothetical protein